MNVDYLPKFLKDLKALKSSTAFESINSLVFDQIPSCGRLEDISNLSKLKGFDNAYRIRVGDYRIGFFLEEDTLTFARVLHRSEIYRYFP
ncbi:MAG: type II toxin-antitoxin system RelE/ParE family toxin [Leptolyngbya sp. Prado105]|nr:type II toxin-antitoxin system RelE/ParE family toxin [Leptolyngbya sp. Prado105]